MVSDRAKFYISAWCGLLGAVVTLLLVPDISGLDLSEGKAKIYLSKSMMIYRMLWLQKRMTLLLVPDVPGLDLLEGEAILYPEIEAVY